MKILVTGGAGFIGSHVCERLLREAYEVVIVDQLNDYYPRAMKLQNLEAVRRTGPVIFYEADICDAGRMGEILRQHRPDAVIHLAARAGVRPSIQDPLLYERVNIHGTMVLLEAVRQVGVRKFVFASSSSIYGISNHVPFSEDDPLNLPVSPYAATKLAGEKICYTYSHLYGIAVVCLRLFTVHGPRQRPDLAIRKFAELITGGKPVPVFGDGSTGRDYTFVDDIASGILAGLRHDCRYEVFNLGNSHPVTLARLVETLEHQLGMRAKIERLPDQPGDVPITYANIAKAQRLLGYQPQTSFDDGIRKFLDWHLAKDRIAAGMAG
jgi:UDP-glucuronate 4-epimerase